MKGWAICKSQLHNCCTAESCHLWITASLQTGSLNNNPMACCPLGPSHVTAQFVSEKFFSRTCHIFFSNLSQTWTRDALGAVPWYNWQNYHVLMLAWLTDGQRDYFRTPPKSQQFRTDWTAYFSVGCRPPARILCPASTEDCNVWSKMYRPAKITRHKDDYRPAKITCAENMP